MLKAVEAVELDLVLVSIKLRQQQKPVHTIVPSLSVPWTVPNTILFDPLMSFRSTLNIVTRRGTHIPGLQHDQMPSQTFIKYSSQTSPRSDVSDASREHKQARHSEVPHYPDKTPRGVTGCMGRLSADEICCLFEDL